MKKFALLLFALAVFLVPHKAHAQSIESCKTGACYGYGPPTGAALNGYIYQDVSQSPPALYCPKNGVWIACGGSGGSASFTPTGIQYATSVTAATVATSAQIQSAIGGGVYAAASEPIGAAAQATANAAAVKSANLGDLTNTNVARTNLGITALPSGALAEFRFNEGTGTALTDYSGNGNNGTLATSTHAPTWNTLTGLNVSQASQQYVTLPAALNAAKTIIVVAQFNPTSSSIPETVVGSSTAAGANGFNFSLSALNSLVGSQQNNSAFIYVNNSAVGSSSQVINQGIQMLSYEIDSTGNAVYANSSLVAGSFGTTSTTPTTGTYQIGCGSIVSTWCLDGTLYAAVFYPTKLTAAQISQAFSALSQTLLSRGISMTAAITPLSVAATNSPLVFKGTSITLGGTNGATPWVNQLTLNTNDGWTVTNIGQGGETLGLMLQQEQQVDQLYTAQSPLATTMIEAGTNDLCLTTPAASIWPTFNALRQYIRRRKAVGWRVIVAPMLPRGNNAGCDAVANLYNAQIRAQWKVMGADAFSDYAADPLLGANGAWSNATYYNSADLTHPTTAGNALIATYVSNTLAGMNSSSSSANPTLATTTYQMLPGDWFVRGNPTAGAFTITLPVCAGMTGTDRGIKNAGTANSLTLAGSGSDLIDGASSISIASGAAVQLRDVLTSTTAAGCHWEKVN